MVVAAAECIRWLLQQLSAFDGCCSGSVAYDGC